MGCNVTVKQFAGFAIYVAAGNQGTDLDIMFAGWNADYPDAYDFFHILLDGRTIHAANNNNLAYINNATLNKQIDAADALTGRRSGQGVRQARHLHDDQAGSVDLHRQPQPA